MEHAKEILHHALQQGAYSLLMETIAPTLGVFIALAMFASPVFAVLRVMKTAILGDLNPLPCLLVMANCAGWIGYSLTNGDLYVFFANGPGFLVGSFLVFGTYPYATKKQQQVILYGFLFFSSLIMSVAIGGVKAMESGQITIKGLQKLWGLTANFNLVCYYAAPLSTLYSVISQGNSASIYMPLSICALVNSTLWVLYGSAKGDMYIAAPNGVGWCFALLQIVLRVLIPVKPAYEAVSTREEELEEGGPPTQGGERKRMVDGRPLATSALPRG